MATIAELSSTGDSSPGATSQDTASLTRVAGNGYLVYVPSFRGSSLNPDSVTLSGWGQTWTEATNCGLLWSNSGTVRRRSQLFYCLASDSGSGVLTFSYTNTPEIIDWIVVNLGPVGDSVIVSGSEKRTTAGASITGATLTESLTMNAVANAANRWVAFATTNVNSTTHRMELDADTNGDADWTTGGDFGSNTTRSRKSSWGWIDVTTDNTPGFLVTDTASWFSCAIEINYVVPTNRVAVLLGGGSIASPTLVGDQRTNIPAVLLGGGSVASPTMVASVLTPEVSDSDKDSIFLGLGLHL